MKLPAIVTRTPAAKIEAAQVLLTAAEARIGQLNTERDAALNLSASGQSMPAPSPSALRTRSSLGPLFWPALSVSPRAW